MSKININENEKDEYNRYKMSRIKTRIEGKGNGIKTILINIFEIAKSLKRPVEYLIKFLAIEQGSKCYYDYSKKQGVINGSPDENTLQNYIYKFIKSWVLCQRCHNPETNLLFRKRTVNLNCLACGYTSNNQILNKVGIFMLNNKSLVDNIFHKKYKTQDLNNNIFENKESKMLDNLEIKLLSQGLKKIEISKDNNCQFHSLLNQLKQLNKFEYLDWDHKTLREDIVNCLKKYQDINLGNNNFIKDKVNSNSQCVNWSEYLEQMRIPDLIEGDDITLLGASILLRAEIKVISSDDIPDIIIVPPINWNISIELFLILGYYSKYHYVGTKLIEISNQIESQPCIDKLHCIYSEPKSLYQQMLEEELKVNMSQKIPSQDSLLKIEDTNISTLKNLISFKIKTIFMNDSTDQEKINQLNDCIYINDLSCEDVFGFIINDIFDDNIVNQLKEFKLILKKIYKSSNDKSKTQKYILKFLVNACIKDTNSIETILPKIPLILKLLYDFDILDEDKILKWGDNKSNNVDINLVKTKAQPFIIWLKEAEEESEEEDSEE